ncbi:MAG TPA: ferredoxin reductase family protein [Gaiellaceae bacterium]|nr:ferredoxin reductase family protein [Gaiellaceae bacterium]
MRLLLFAGAYLGVTLLPLGVILLGDEPASRGFWVELGVAFGFIGLAMIALQAILTARLRRVSAFLGQDTLLQFHRQAGIVAVTLVLAHPLVLVLADSGYWAFLDPRVNLPRALALGLVLVALPALVVTALWRGRLRIPYERWRAGHAALAALVLAVGLVHIVSIRHYLEDPLKQALWVAVAAASMASVAYVRLLRPLQLLRRPYRVVAVEPEAAGVWAVAVEPERPAAFQFQAGQFALLTLGRSPFSLEQHPFSISSSARRPERLEFTIKELGDFTSRIGEVAVGTRAYVDGPYGSLVLPRAPDAGLVLVAGGIGITPVVSMLRTLRDDGDRRPIVLVYANDEIADIVFAGELEQMAAGGELDLRVVRVLARPPAGWTGEAGMITRALLARYLPGEPGAWRYVLCGPAPMMEAAEQALLELGVPLGRIESERFDIEAAQAIGPRHAQVRRLVLALAGIMVLGSTLFAARLG